jgi:hypothetical protein
MATHFIDDYVIISLAKSLREDGSLYYGQLRSHWSKPQVKKPSQTFKEIEDEKLQDFSFNYRVI